MKLTDRDCVYPFCKTDGAVNDTLEVHLLYTQCLQLALEWMVSFPWDRFKNCLLVIFGRPPAHTFDIKVKDTITLYSIAINTVY